MEMSTLLILGGTASLVVAKLGIMAFCVHCIAKAFGQPIVPAHQRNKAAIR